VAEVETVQRGDVVSCEVLIEAGPDTIFPFFTDPDRMVRWMGTSAEIDARPGGRYRIDVQGTYAASGEFVEVDPPRRVVFTWGWENEDALVPPGSSTVEVELVPEGESTLVRLTHRDLPIDMRDQHAHGWTHYLGRLALGAEGGDPGPDTGPEGSP
jgi:uncharacterized protein YndB with AHSA1/START domain